LWTPPAVLPTLRPYQVAAVDQVERAWAAGHRAPLLVLPTGAGKTVCFAEVIRRELAERGEAPAACLVAVPRRELVGQTVAKLHDVGIDPGVLCAGMEDGAGPSASVQVCSVDTLHARVQRRDDGRRLVLPSPRLLVIDECHLSITKRKVELIESLGPERLLGCTATPTRRDGRALKVLYDLLLQPATVASLTAAGHLVPARYWGWPSGDLRAVHVDSKTHDYQVGQLAAAMNQPKLLGDIVEHWLRLAGDRRTVCFTVDIAHAVALAEAFRRAGVAAEHVSAETPTPERAATLTRFRSGETQVVCNCFVLAYGYDLPEIGCCVLARPTKSLMLFLQMVGRALRPAPDKADCLVLDHAGAVHEHGLVADERAWTLDGHDALVPSPSRLKGQREAKTCPQCAAIWTGSRACPECGFTLQPKGRLVPTLDGALVEIGAAADAEVQDQLQFYLELRGYGEEHEYKRNWAACQFRARYGAWPPWDWNTEPALEPSLATRRWIKSRHIAWWRSRRTANAAGAGA
jgi:superfamily II DNA or RNA helicase